MCLRARFALTLSFFALLSTALAAEPLLGVAAPMSGPSALLGTQVRDGATLAAEKTGADIALVDDQCTAAGGAKAAEDFVNRKVALAVGFLCSEALEAALPALKQAGIPVITIGVRSNSLTDNREKTGWPIYRLAPRADGEASAVSRVIPGLWREKPFAIIDDGTIYGRELAESLRSAVEQLQLKPVFLDVYRPQLDNQIGLVGRLRKAGSTAVFVGGDRDDVAIMGRDSAALDAGITFAGGEALRAASNGVALAKGTVMIGLPEWSEIADPAVITAFGARNVMAEGYALPAYAAVEIAVAATAGGTTGIGLFGRLDEDEFKTAIGPFRFDSKGDLTESLYRAYTFDGVRFVPMGIE
jgi:branched-chain amino acid transport system substrate-binding protein